MEKIEVNTVTLSGNLVEPVKAMSSANVEFSFFKIVTTLSGTKSYITILLFDKKLIERISPYLKEENKGKRMVCSGKLGLGKHGNLQILATDIVLLDIFKKQVNFDDDV